MAIDLAAAKAALLNRPKGSGTGTGESSELRWYKLPSSGEAKIRFLPPVEGKLIPGKIVWKHFNMPDIGSITCLKTWKMDCPICRFLNEIKFKVDKSIEDFESKSRAYHNVLVVSGYDNNGQKCDSKLPYIMGSTEYNYFWLLDQVTNEDIGDITDPATGSNVTFKRKRENGPMERLVARQSTAIATDEEDIEKILNMMPDLDKIWKEPDDEFMAKVKMTAKALKIQIEERIGSVIPASEEVNAPKPSAKPVSSPKSGSEDKSAEEIPKSNKPAKPASARECFGKHSEKCGKGEECTLCPDELECEEFEKG